MTRGLSDLSLLELAWLLFKLRAARFLLRLGRLVGSEGAGLWLADRLASLIDRRSGRKQ